MKLTRWKKLHKHTLPADGYELATALEIEQPKDDAEANMLDVTYLGERKNGKLNQAGQVKAVRFNWQQQFKTKNPVKRTADVVPFAEMQRELVLQYEQDCLAPLQTLVASLKAHAEKLDAGHQPTTKLAKWGKKLGDLKKSIKEGAKAVEVNKQARQAKLHEKEERKRKRADEGKLSSSSKRKTIDEYKNSEEAKQEAEKAHETWWANIQSRIQELKKQGMRTSEAYEQAQKEFA